MSSTTGNNSWVSLIERADDGKPVAATTWQSIDELASRTQFLLRNSQLAAANYRQYHSTANVDWYSGACYAPGAGPYDSGLYVVCGRGSSNRCAIAMSADAENWNAYQHAALGFTNFTPYGVAHGAGAFAFCGQSDGSPATPSIFTAPDSASDGAQPQTPEIASSAFTGRYVPTSAGLLRSICWNGTVFCAVGNDGLIVTLSSDLATHNVRTPGSSYTGHFHHVFADSAGRLFAVGDLGEVQRSTNNGATWTRVHSDPTLGTLRSGVPGLIGCSSGQRVLRSVDNGANWSPVIVTVNSWGGPAYVYQLGAVMGVHIKHATNPIYGSYYSFDGGASWPLRNTTPIYGVNIRAISATEQRVIVAAALHDDTTAGVVFASASLLGAA